MGKNRTIVTEEMHPEKEWFEAAKRQTNETLASFVDQVMNYYAHDYGTVCHAISACALAAAYAANNEEGACGGITGFQAGFVMFDFIREWNYPNNKTGLAIRNFDDMLYPQYDYKFDKVLKRSMWNAIKAEAEKKLEEDSDVAALPVIEHWRKIARGIVPFGYRVVDD